MRRFGILVLSVAVLAVLVLPTSAHAATIPPRVNKAVCQVRVASAPVMTSFVRSPSNVDVRTVGKHVTFTIKAHATSDIDALTVLLNSPRSRSPQRIAVGHAFRPSLGTERNGTWHVVVKIPRWTLPGIWKVESVLLHTKTRYAYYYPNGAGTKPWKSTWPTTLEVQSHPDVKAPTISQVVLSPRSVDTSSAAKSILVTLKLRDDLSGVANARISAVYVEGVLVHDTSGGTLTQQLGGTSKDGTWSGKLTVPRWTGSGTNAWSLSLQAYDRAGNGLFLGTSDLEAMHLTSTFTVTSRSDAHKPVLKGLSFSPRSVDARAGAKTVSVTLRASDGQSGVSLGRVVFTSPSGALSLGGYVHRSSGWPSSGTWEGSVTIPRCSEPGTWTVAVYLWDFARNRIYLPTAQISALGIASTLRVKALDWQAPTASVPSTVAHDGPVLVTFSEPTLWPGSTSVLTLSDWTTGMPVAGAWTCNRANGDPIGCNADGAMVKTASFQPSSSLSVGDAYAVGGSGFYDTSGNGPGYVNATLKVL
jgi:hypothetical protein